VERLGVPLAGEGDDFVFAQRWKGPQFDDLALAEIFEVEDGAPSCPACRRLTVTEGG
jgi:hypothetical protein